METNAQIREKLRHYLALFVERNCQYNSADNGVVLDCLKTIQPVDDWCEKYNIEHPEHGVPFATVKSKR